MSQDERENALGTIIDQLAYELGFSSLSQLWDEAGVTANRAAWYKRVAPNSNARTTEKQLTKLIQGLERAGHTLHQEQKDRLYAAIGMRILKHEELDRVRRLEALKDLDRQRLLDSRLARFVPGTRQVEITEILIHIEELKSKGGYLAITGQAGEGKTTLVAQLIASYSGYKQTAYHIIPFNPGIDHQVTLLHSLMASLALKHPYLSDFWTQNFHRDSLAGTFALMLREISTRGSQEVLFIDGLDQIKPDASMEERDLDFLPLEVPKGIVIVASTRPDDTLKPLQLRSPLRRYELPKLNRVDVDRILTHYKIQMEKGIVDQLCLATQQNAFYIDLVAEELTHHTSMETISPEELLRHISNNPSNIFSFAIERMKYPAYSWKTIIKPILGLLLATQEPVSAVGIGQILVLEDENRHDGLRRLGGLVEEDGSGKYYLYHLKFREYLGIDKDQPDKERIISQQEMRLHHKQLADWCASTDLLGGKTIWKDVKDTAEQERRVYARHYYIKHLYEAQEWQRLFAILDEGVYGRAKIDYDPSTRSYAQDLDLGRKATEQKYRDDFEEGIKHLPYLWRYTLLLSGLSDQADRYPAEAFRLLVLLNRGPKAIGLAELLTKPRNKVHVLLVIAEQLQVQGRPEGEYLEILLRIGEVAQTVEDFERAWALKDVTRALAQVGQWERAEAVSRSIENANERDKALNKLVEALAQVGQWERAEAVSRSIENINERDEALNKLATALAQAEQWERAEVLWDEVQAGIDLIGHNRLRDRAWSDLAKALAQAQQWERAEAVSRSIEDAYQRDQALSELAKALTQAEQWGQAEEVSCSIEGAYQRGEMLSGLARALAQTQQWEQAEAVSRSIENAYQQSRALNSLAKALAQAQQWERVKVLWREIEVMIRMMLNSDRAEALKDLGETLTQAQQWKRAEELLNEAGACICSIGDDLDRLEPLKDLGRVLAQMQQWERIETVIRSIKDTYDQATVLSGLGEALAQAQQWERAETVSHSIVYDTQRIECLIELGKALVQAQQWERAEKIWQEAESIIRSPKNIDVSFQRGYALNELVWGLVQTQQWELAEAVSRSIGNIYQRSTALNSLAKALAQVQRWEHAKVLCKEALALIGSIEPFVLQVASLRDLGETLLQVQEWEQAEAVIRFIENINERDEALGEIAKALAQAGQWERAEAVSRSIEGAFQRDQTLSEIAKALAQAGQWERAEVVSHSIEGACWRTIALNGLGKTLVQTGQWERAEAVRASIENHSWQEAILKAIEQAFAQAEQYDSDWTDLMFSSGENDDKFAFAMSNFGEALAQARQWEQAEEIWDETKAIIHSIKNGDQRIKALRGFGIVLSWVRQWDRVKVVIASIGNSKERAGALRDLGKALLQTQQWEHAETVIRSIEDDSEQARALRDLGEALLQAQQWEHAETVIHSIKWNRMRASALSSLGKAFAQMQQWERAKAVWNEVGAVIQSEHGWIRAEAVETLAAAMAKAGAYGQLISMLYYWWRSASSQAEALDLFPPVVRFIPQYPELGDGLYKAFSWVDTYFKGDTTTVLRM